MGIIVLLTIGTIASAVSGVARGIRWLSNVNMVLALALAVFFFVVGPTAFILNVIPGVLMDYVGEMPDMLCLLYTSPSPRDATLSRMPSSA